MSLTEVLSSLTKNTWNYKKRACPASCARIVLCFRKHQTDLLLPEHFGWLTFSYTASKALFEFGVVMENVRVRRHSWCINVNECPYKDNQLWFLQIKWWEQHLLFGQNMEIASPNNFRPLLISPVDDASLLFFVVTLFPLTLCTNKVILPPFVVNFMVFCSLCPYSCRSGILATIQNVPFKCECYTKI